MTARPAASSRVPWALVLTVLLAIAPGCARLLTRPTRLGAHDAAAIVAAGATRERALVGLRLTLSVRATSGPPAARLASPAYLAIDDPEHLHLQVLSPFGVTVLDLATSGDAFTLALPLRGETRHGTIDFAALAAGATPEDERMIVALALLFRPKMDVRRCRAAGPASVRCTIADALTVTTTVDDALRPVRETYAGAHAGPLFTAVFEGYQHADGDTLPQRITIADDHDAASLVIRVVKVRRAGDSAV